MNAETWAMLGVAIGGALLADRYPSKRIPILGTTAVGVLLLGSAAVAQAIPALPPAPSPVLPYQVGQTARLPMADLPPNVLPAVVNATAMVTGEQPTGALIKITKIPSNTPMNEQPPSLDGMIVGWYIEAPGRDTGGSFAESASYGPVRVPISLVHAR